MSLVQISHHSHNAVGVAVLSHFPLSPHLHPVTPVLGQHRVAVTLAYPYHAVGVVILSPHPSVRSPLTSIL